jgi:transcriptional regulator with XRE-family HTH domain
MSLTVSDNPPLTLTLSVEMPCLLSQAPAEVRSHGVSASPATSRTRTDSWVGLSIIRSCPCNACFEGFTSVWLQDTVFIYGFKLLIEVKQMETAKQEALVDVDISSILRQIMAVRRLSVSDLASAAGVSKSAMEKYLAGPSSPRLVALVSLSKALKLSLDRLVFGEIDVDEELIYGIAFQHFWSLITDLKTDPALSKEFASLDAASPEFSDFTRNLAYSRAVSTRATFRENRRDAHFNGSKIVAL